MRNRGRNSAPSILIIRFRSYAARAADTFNSAYLLDMSWDPSELPLIRPKGGGVAPAASILDSAYSSA